MLGHKIRGLIKQVKEYMDETKAEQTATLIAEVRNIKSDLLVETTKLRTELQQIKEKLPTK